MEAGNLFQVNLFPNIPYCRSRRDGARGLPLLGWGTSYLLVRFGD